MIGRYILGAEIAAGGMATVHLGRLVGPIGFSRTVAIKRLHPNLAKDSEFIAMFVDEARLAARIRHPNVVPIVDVVSQGDELFLVMEYVAGEALSSLMKALRANGSAVPPAIATSIMVAALQGIHAAHEARSERGEPLFIVHRDVSPQNIIVGVDGISRVFDFGIAKAVGRIQTTQEGETKGKLAYMSPEQLSEGPVDRRTDIYAAGVVLWEALSGRRLHEAESAGRLVARILKGAVPAPSSVVRDLPPALDAVFLRALAPEPDGRFATALDMAIALEQAIPPIPGRELGQWVESIAGEALRTRAELVRQFERGEGEAFDGEHAAVGSSGPSTLITRDQLPVESRAQAEEPTTPSPRSLPVPQPQRRPRRWRIISASALATIALASIAFRFDRFRANATPQAEASVPVVAASTAPPTPPPALSTGMAASTSPPVLAPTAPATPTPATSAPNRTPRKAPSAIKTPSCDHPFTVDADGFRHPRPECLQMMPASR